MIYFHKILPLIFSPVFIIILLIIFYFFFRKKIFIFLSLLLLIFFSNPIISKKLVNYIEIPYVPLKTSSVKEADYVVVLSGMIHKIQSNNESYVEWGDPDRFFAGINLFKEGKAKKIVFTGGKLPWETGKITEGEFLKSFAIEFKIDPDDIIVTDEVQNTFEEANQISNLIPKKSSIILVTSAFHMKRAKSLFEKFDLLVIPFPVDFKSSSNKLTFMDFMPSSGALSGSSMVIREIQGRIYYDFINLLR